MKILLVEDNIQLNKALSTLLKRNSYLLDSAFDGEEALIFIRDYIYDIIVLDIMLPHIDGLEVLKRIRRDNIQTPVILLTARSTVEDKITGLDLGADDYLAKPFSTEELLARIRALGRRKVQEYHHIDDIKYHDIIIKQDKSVIICQDKEESLSNKEIHILLLLIETDGKVLSVESITSKAWEMDDYAIDANVWVYISYLRKKLENVGSKIKIKSKRYQGYYLEYKND